MVEKKRKRPRDPVQLAKLIGDIATGATHDAVEDGKDPKRVAAGSAGGKKGGKARAKSLTAPERTAIAKNAISKRWKK